MTILEREQALIKAMHEQHFQPFFDGDREDAQQTLDDAFTRLITYQNSVIKESAMSPILYGCYADDPEKLQNARMNLDKTRRIHHDAAIASCNMLNRICDGYGVEPLVPVDTKDRYAVADYISQFCSELYETGQGRHATTANQWYEHNKHRTNEYATDHITHRMSERAKQANSDFGHLLNDPSSDTQEIQP